MMLKSKKHHKLLPALLLAALGLWPALPPVQAAVPSLPVLNWQQRSDWINVKTNVTPKAVGDGVHDDTAALQAGLNALYRGYYGKKTLYLPAGTYRITKTLTLAKFDGALIIGQGQATRIKWDGPLRQTMFWSNGVRPARYVGIVWDGAGKAAVGVDHQSKTYSESRIRHEDEAFVNFQIAGIRVGFNQVQPTSEITYRNCSFQNCGNGIAILSANDYNNSIDGCEFQDDNIAINCVIGNVYVRECHFERSRAEDIFLCSHSHSVRRCTSVGSGQFIVTGNAGSACPVTVQDCHVDGWTSHNGAMQFGMRGPTTVFDSSFTHPPDADAPIRLTNSWACTQTVLLSDNSAPASSVFVDQGQSSQISEIPSGERGPSLSDPKQSFLKSTETVPTVVFDVKTQFGAVGNAYHDDTAAVLGALAAARARGGNAVVYFPGGKYNVSQTLPIVGGNYTVEGSGQQTEINWVGPKGGVVFGVQDPDQVALKHLVIDAPLDTAAVQQTSAGAASSRMTYQDVCVGSNVLGPGDNRNPNPQITQARVCRGLECVGLTPGTTVLLDDLVGTSHFTDCSRAVILGDFVMGGTIQVDGGQYAKTGFLGILAHNTALNTCDVVVNDNQDFVGTNFYAEQTQMSLYVSGDGAYAGQPGHVTIQGSKTQNYGSTSIHVNDYEGRVTYANAGVTAAGMSQEQVTHAGVRPTDIVLLGDMFSGLQPNLSFGPGARLTSIGSYVMGAHASAMHPMPNFLSGLSNSSTALLLASDAANSSDAAEMAPAIAALDDFRQLGAYDLAINYP